MFNKRVALACVPATVIALWHPNVGTCRTYNFTDIDFPGAAETQVFGLNDSGYVVGVYGELDNSLKEGVRGFIFDGESYETIEVPGALGTSAEGLNDRGEVVGAYLAADGRTRGFLYDGTSYKDIGPGDAGLVSPSDIDNSGRIVGSYSTGELSFPLIHGFELVGEEFSVFDYPGDFTLTTFISGINGQNERVGSYQGVTGSHGFMLPGEVEINHPQGSILTVLTDINDSGLVTGNYIRQSPGAALYVGFVHSLEDGTFEDITFPGVRCAFDGNGPVPPEKCLRAIRGINSKGTIVGFYDNDDGVFHGFVGTPEVELEAGDANMDLEFNQADIVEVLTAGKYLTVQAATWGEGDWDGAPGGLPGNPPDGDGLFDQLDIVAALAAGRYLTGPYASELEPLAVPEPATLQSLLIALGLLGCQRRRLVGSRRG